MEKDEVSIIKVRIWNFILSVYTASGSSTFPIIRKSTSSIFLLVTAPIFNIEVLALFALLERSLNVIYIDKISKDRISTF